MPEIIKKIASAFGATFLTSGDYPEGIVLHFLRSDGQIIEVIIT